MKITKADNYSTRYRIVTDLEVIESPIEVDRNLLINAFNSPPVIYSNDEKQIEKAKQDWVNNGKLISYFNVREIQRNHIGELQRALRFNTWSIDLRQEILRQDEIYSNIKMELFKK